MTNTLLTWYDALVATVIVVFVFRKAWLLVKDDRLGWAMATFNFLVAALYGFLLRWVFVEPPDRILPLPPRTWEEAVMLALRTGLAAAAVWGWFELELLAWKTRRLGRV